MEPLEGITLSHVALAEAVKERPATVDVERDGLSAGHDASSRGEANGRG